jgi:hypothetical protein
MSLQGSLEEFSLTDLFAHLVDESASGVLQLDGADGQLELFLGSGWVVGCSPAGPASAAEAILAMVRADMSSFEFVEGWADAAGFDAAPLSLALAEAQARHAASSRPADLQWADNRSARARRLGRRRRSEAGPTTAEADGGEALEDRGPWTGEELTVLHHAWEDHRESGHRPWSAASPADRDVPPPVVLARAGLLG